MATAQSSLGQLGVVAPPSMTQGVPEIVTARISRDNRKNIAAILRQAYPSTKPRQVASSSIKVSSRMRAYASGDGFKIESADPGLPDERPLLLDQDQTWSWRVTPLKSGDAMQVSVYAIAYVDLPGHPEQQIPLEPDVETIPVKVNYPWMLQQWVVQYQKYLIPEGEGVTALGLLFAWLRKRLSPASSGR